MGNYQPRVSLPEDWIEKAKCPVCKSRELQVIHSAGLADQLACGDCKTAFEVEQGSPHLRLTRVPKSLSDYRGTLVGSWITTGELRLLINKIKTTEAGEELPAPAENGLEQLPRFTPKELIKRVESMLTLGYTAKNIIEAMERLGITSNEVKNAIAQVRAGKKRKHKLEGIILWASLALVVMIILVGIIWLFVLGGFQQMLA